MIIRTNLCSELLDPNHGAVRPRVWVGLAVAVLCLSAFGYWFSLQNEVAGLSRDVAAVKAKQRKMGAELEAARTRSVQLTAKIAQRTAIVDFAKGRLNWAPVLEKIFAAVPGNIEISAVGTSIVRNGESSLQIEGKAAGEQPRQECDKFRVLLLSALEDAGPTLRARFASLEDTEKPTHVGESSFPSALFRIELKWIQPPANE